MRICTTFLIIQYANNVGVNLLKIYNERVVSKGPNIDCRKHFEASIV